MRLQERALAEPLGRAEHDTDVPGGDGGEGPPDSSPDWFDVSISTGAPAATMRSYWSRISAIRGLTTMVMPSRASAGTW